MYSATALICACELIRREDPATWGDEPFRIGLWVGQRSTPNRTEDAAEILKQDHGFAPTLGGRGTPYQLTNCPWCGTPLKPDHVLRLVNKKGTPWRLTPDMRLVRNWSEPEREGRLALAGKLLEGLLEKSTV